MAKKKEDTRLSVDWGAIETLFVINGLTPLQLARMYQVTAKTVSQQAYVKGWVEKRNKEQNRFATRQRMFKDRLGEKIFSTMESMINKIAVSVDADEMGPTIQDGEGLPNRFFLETWKAVTSNAMKIDPDDADEEQEQSGFNINGPDAPD